MAGLRSEARRAELLRRATEAIVRGGWARRDGVVWRREGEEKKEKRDASVAVASLSKKDAGREVGEKNTGAGAGSLGDVDHGTGLPPLKRFNPSCTKNVLEVRDIHGSQDTHLPLVYPVKISPTAFNSSGVLQGMDGCLPSFLLVHSVPKGEFHFSRVTSLLGMEESQQCHGVPQACDSNLSWRRTVCTFYLLQALQLQD